MSATTVRVDSDAKKKLNALADSSDMSTAAYLNQLVEQAWWEASCALEREAQRADSASPEVAAEDSEWDGTAADGIE
jgi:predicted transcriptional regulator